MKNSKIMLIIVAVISFFILGQTQEKEEEILFEEVNVVNVQFPVRVFSKGLPVSGLKKEDFQIFVNRKKTPIHGFYEVRKKLGESQKSPTKDIILPSPHRLFVLIFNISDYTIDLKKNIDIIFRNILRLDDRYIVISNDSFLPVTVLKNPEVEKKRILKTLQEDSNKLKMNLLQIEADLRGVALKLFNRLGDYAERTRPDYPYSIFKDFFRDFLITYQQARQGLFRMPLKHYVKMADYLKRQDAEKWVLSFFQIGVIPKIRSMGKIQRAINQYESDFEMKRLLMDFLPSLVSVDNWLVENISKLFVNSGATFHTLLIKPINKKFLDYYEYQTISIDSESILRKVAQMTGGSVKHSMAIGDFVNKIAAKEDIYYMLTYVPDTGGEKNSSIKVVLKNKKNYRLSYSNQSPPLLIKKILNNLKQDNLQIKIEDIQLKDDILSVIVFNIKTITLDSKEEKKIGKIQTKVTILDDKSEIVWETNKKFKCKKNKSMFLTKIPSLREGNYNVRVEVKDLLNWKIDIAVETIKIGFYPNKS